MRNKAALSLMEQLVMILVFSLAAALCLGAFAKAQATADATARRETGAQIAQNGVEWLKSGGSLDDLSLPEGYSVEFYPQQEDTPGLAIGTVEVRHETQKEPVFSLPAAWQEVVP